jgi:hypothetical protein
MSDTTEQAEDQLVTAVDTSGALEEPDEADPAETSTEDQGDEPATANAEAARWRKQFRAAEQDRDLLAGQVAALQKAAADDLITRAGVKPSAVFTITNLDALIDDTGAVSPKLVATAVAAARDQLGIAPIGKGNYVPGVGNQPGRPPKTDGWQDAFAPTTKR